MQALEPSQLLSAIRLAGFQDPLGTVVRISLNGESELVLSRYTSPDETRLSHHFTADALVTITDLLFVLSSESGSDRFSTGAVLRIRFRSTSGEIEREIPEPNKKERRFDDRNFMAAWRAIHSPYAAAIKKYETGA